MKLPPIKKKQAPPSNMKNALPMLSNRLIYLTVFLFFSSSFFCVFFGFKTIIGLFEFLRIFALSIAIALLIQNLFLRSAFPMNNAERLTFSIFGLGPALCAGFFMLNFIIPIESETNRHLVFESFQKNGSTYFTAEGLPCEDYPELCIKYMVDEITIKSGEYIDVRIDKGIGGYLVMKKIETVRDPASLTEE